MAELTNEIPELLKLLSETFTIGCEERTRISAALLELQARREADKCGGCKGTGLCGFGRPGFGPCPDCNGTGKRDVNAELVAALRELLDVIKLVPEMNGRQYVQLGIKVNAALARAAWNKRPGDEVMDLAQKVADTFCEMTPLHQTKTIFDLTDACRALAAALPRNK